MISKEQYVLDRVKSYAQLCTMEKRKMRPATVTELIEQWSFEYEIEKQYRPEILTIKLPEGSEESSEQEESSVFYKVSMYHQDGYVEEKFTKDFNLAEKMVHNNEFIYLAWVSEYQSTGENFKPTFSWQYQKAKKDFIKTKHKII